MASQNTGVARSIITQEVNKEYKTLSGNYYWSKSSVLDKIKNNYNNTGKAKQVYQYDINGKFIASFNSCAEAARVLTKGNHSHISECCRGKIPTYKNFIWRYAEDIVSTFEETQRDAYEAS